MRKMFLPTLCALIICTVPAFALADHDHGDHGKGHGGPKHQNQDHGNGKNKGHGNGKKDQTHGPSYRVFGRHDNGLHLGHFKNGKGTSNFRVQRDRRSNPPFTSQHLIYVAPNEYHDQNWWYAHRRHVQNEWETLAVVSGLIGVLGYVKHDNTLFFAGAAGALYSVYRLNEDRKSTDRQRRLRATYFSKPYFWRDGVCYHRQTVRQNGHEYYQFRRG